MTDKAGWERLAEDDYNQALQRAVGQGYTTAEQHLLFSIAASLIAQRSDPPKKRLRWPLRRAVR